MLSLKQKVALGYDLSQVMDDLSYHYYPGTNTLERVEDAASYYTGRDFKNNNAGTTDMKFNIQPVLENEKAILCPLQEDDFEALYAVASDPAIWEQHPNKDRWKRKVFRNFFDGAMQKQRRIQDHRQSHRENCRPLTM